MATKTEIARERKLALDKRDSGLEKKWAAFVRFQKKHPRTKGVYRVLKYESRIVLEKYEVTPRDVVELIEFPLRARNTLRLVQKAIRESEDYMTIKKLYRIFNYTSKADVNESVNRLLDDGKILVDKKNKIIIWIYASPARMKKLMKGGLSV